MSFTLERRGPKRKRPEADFQSHLVDVLRQRLEGALVFHIPNGVNQPLPAALRLRRMGLTAGIPDLAVLHAGGKILFLECKAQMGSVSPEQNSIFAEIRALGHRVEVVREVAEALQYCGEAGIKVTPLDRARDLFKRESAKSRRAP
jgi:hypothetical protein